MNPELLTEIKWQVCDKKKRKRKESGLLERAETQLKKKSARATYRAQRCHFTCLFLAFETQVSHLITLPLVRLPLTQLECC